VRLLERGARSVVQRGLIAVAAAGLLAGVPACGSSSAGRDPGSATATAAAAARPAKLDAPSLATPPQPARDFTLRDSLGKRVQLSYFRGQAVLLTFIYDHCPDVCPLIVANLHSALSRLGRAGDHVQIVAVSVDPRGDTPKTVNAFLKAHEMTGRMEYLIGNRRTLAPVWKAWGVQVQASPEDREQVGHSAFVYGISGSGKTTALYPANFKPAWIVHDVPLLAAR
jgi:protein SCO1